MDQVRPFGICALVARTARDLHVGSERDRQLGQRPGIQALDDA